MEATAAKFIGAVIESIGEIPHLWAYQPNFYRWLFPFLIVLPFAMLVFFRFTNPDRDAIDRRIAIERRVQDLAARNFKPAAGPLGEIPALPTRDDAVLLMGDTIQLPASGMTAQHQALAYADRSIDFVVMVPFQDAFWAHKSRIEFEHGDPMELFKRADILARLNEAQNLICVGLASRRQSDVPEDVQGLNERLSRDRARNLCSYVASAVGPAGAKQYWTLSLGYSNAPANTPAAESAQRSAVVIGASGATPAELLSAIRRIIRATHLNSVELNAYSRSDTAQLLEQRINWGKLELVEGVEYENAER